MLTKTRRQTKMMDEDNAAHSVAIVVPFKFDSIILQRLRTIFCAVLNLTNFASTKGYVLHLQQRARHHRAFQKRVKNFKFCYSDCRKKVLSRIVQANQQHHGPRYNPVICPLGPPRSRLGCHSREGGRPGQNSLMTEVGSAPY
jgi:hypothetical protein